VSGHTPGPWRAFNHSWSDTSILAHGFDHAICLLDINHATEGSQDADEALMAANARLIAAAPDLLEACRLFLGYNADEGDDGIAFMLAYERAVSAALQAVAKATGAQS